MEWVFALAVVVGVFVVPPVAIGVGVLVLHRRGFFSRIRRVRVHEGAIAQDAAARGWSYQPTGNPWLLNVTAPPFGTGDAQRVTDVVTGSRSAGPFVAFRLERILRADNSSGESVRRWNVVSVPLPQTIPQIAFTPEGALEAALMAEVNERWRPDLDVESHAFNMRWNVGTQDPDCAHAVLTPAVIAELIDAPPDLACITIEDGNLLAVSTWPALNVAWIDQTLDTLESVRAGIPQFAWDKWGIADRGLAPNVGHD